MIKVYYDGKCGLCRREIAFYKRISPHGRIDWCDITAHPDALLAHKVSLEDALKALHVEDKASNLHIGVDAFVLIWKQIPVFKPLAFVVSLPLINGFTRLSYKWFAAWRYKRLRVCAVT
jgi:predicted DCC family thiol-disulfide oxidoreductase YuxK